MQISRLRTNRMENPLGFQMETASVSYVVEDCGGTRQQAAQIVVARDREFAELIYDSGVSEEIDSICYPLPLTLQPRTRYYWKVTVWADNGEMAVSETAWFETPKGQEEAWAGHFITQSFAQEVHPVFRKQIKAADNIVQARFYGVGLGVYELYVNGKKVGDECLLPGIHAYDSWLQYQTFELDLKPGINEVEARLGEGWYKGPYGLKPQLPRHGSQYAFLGEIRMLGADGSEEVIGTDETWKAAKGKVVFDSIYDGETYDERISGREQYPVKAADLDTSRVTARLSPRIKIHERIKPVRLIVTPAGEYVLDMGQNMVGWMEFQVEQPEGTEVVLCFGEILQDGNFYRDNLRDAKCEYRYISDGTPATARGYFSFYGFRYVKVLGWLGELRPEDFTGCVIHSEMEEIGTMETSDSSVNQLLSNIRWGQKGNFLDTPTDCPQRDERMGWTGDAQIFADTASYNMDTYAFYRKFMQDLAYEQTVCGGSVPYVVPMSRYELNGASAWGDAAAIIPWTVYLHSGDKTILQKQYSSMKAWVEYIRHADEQNGAKRLWQSGRHFGDWLALDGKVDGGVYGSTDKFYIATAYYYYSALLTGKAAGVIGEPEEERQYLQLADEIKQAFLAEYYTPAGRLSVDTQTAYAMAIYMGLMPDGQEARVYSDFKEKMKENSFALNTGFVGTPYLCPALSESGWHELACSLLMREQYPGWLYEVNMGATTIWERWNSVLPDGRISGTGMNSLNHYAYGSIAGWMYRYLMGIKPVEEAPGFRRATIAPLPTWQLKQLSGQLKTPAGTYKVSWKIDGDQDGAVTIEITIPFGAAADVYLPRAADSAWASQGWEQSGDDLYRCLSAGAYTFTYKPVRPYRKTYGMDSNLNELMNIPEARAIIVKYFPLAERGIPFQGEGTIVEEIAVSPFGEVADEALAGMKAELELL